MWPGTKPGKDQLSPTDPQTGWWEVDTLGCWPLRFCYAEWLADPDNDSKYPFHSDHTVPGAVLASVLTSLHGTLTIAKPQVSYRHFTGKKTGAQTDRAVCARTGLGCKKAETQIQAGVSPKPVLQAKRGSMEPGVVPGAAPLLKMLEALCAQ